MIYALVTCMVLASISIIILLRELFINSFKISYYETKLENRGVDISSVKDAGVIDILKM